MRYFRRHRKQAHGRTETEAQGQSERIHTEHNQPASTTSEAVSTDLQSNVSQLRDLFSLTPDLVIRYLR
ncbi:MAG: hypothetical protein ACXVDJ_03955, partial [Tumebacillaceae bacterium]